MARARAVAVLAATDQPRAGWVLTIAAALALGSGLVVHVADAQELAPNPFDEAPSTSEEAAAPSEEALEADAQAIDTSVLDELVIDDLVRVEPAATPVPTLRAFDPGWQMERFEARFAFFYQDGRGLQSQASEDRRGPGSEEILVYQPILYTRVRQDRGTVHELILPVDIITAASPDALDAVSTASQDNESFTLEGRHHVSTDEDTTFTLRWQGHVEETLRSGGGGLGLTRELADDNAVLTTSFDIIFDYLDPVQPNGYDPKAVGRLTGTLNLSLSQLLSPTTVAEIAYGFTAQTGQLATTWNSTPIADFGGRIGERFPRNRLRHAFRFSLRQAIPESHTFLDASYRFYVDDIGILAHTAQLQLTQYILPTELWARASYRLHTQTAASFWTDLWARDANPDAPRTSDSDLSAFTAHEVGGSLRWFYDSGDTFTALTTSWLELSYAHYERTNGLHMDVVSLGWGHAL